MHAKLRLGPGNLIIKACIKVFNMWNSDRLWND